MGCRSKAPQAGQMFLFEFLDVAEPETNSLADHEMANSVDSITENALDRLCRDFPAFGEVLFCQDVASGLRYALSGGHVEVVH